MRLVSFGKPAFGVSMGSHPIPITSTKPCQIQRDPLGPRGKVVDCRDLRSTCATTCMHQTYPQVSGRLWFGRDLRGFTLNLGKICRHASKTLPIGLSFEIVEERQIGFTCPFRNRLPQVQYTHVRMGRSSEGTRKLTCTSFPVWKYRDTRCWTHVLPNRVE